MVKPEKLSEGDRVAAISLSWGGAGEHLDFYHHGVRQIESLFSLKVIPTKNALKSNKWLYKNPEARAEDLMNAFQDKTIKAIISIAGGADSIRIVPYLDLQIIKANPKIFMGFSDSTVVHLCCYRAGLVTFYGPSVFISFTEIGGTFQYQADNIKKTLFSSTIIGTIAPNLNGWTSQKIEFDKISSLNAARKINPSSGWRFLLGSRAVTGKLIGGCLQVLELTKGTEIDFQNTDWENSILFIETSGKLIDPFFFLSVLRNYAARGVFHKIVGLIVGRPYNNRHWKQYDEMLLQVINQEQGIDLPIVTGLDFGHTRPAFIIPYGLNAKIDPLNNSIQILESATA
jgi:muramoyltetrapeptide carboxypeptidase LdcA involved in peptidoglycan recycling